jgi:hypothetical protein
MEVCRHDRDEEVNKSLAPRSFGGNFLSAGSTHRPWPGLLTGPSGFQSLGWEAGGKWWPWPPERPWRGHLGAVDPLPGSPGPEGLSFPPPSISIKVQQACLDTISTFATLKSGIEQNLTPKLRATQPLRETQDVHLLG